MVGHLIRKQSNLRITRPQASGDAALENGDGVDGEAGVDRCVGPQTPEEWRDFFFHKWRCTRRPRQRNERRARRVTEPGLENLKVERLTDLYTNAPSSAPLPELLIAAFAEDQLDAVLAIVERKWQSLEGQPGGWALVSLSDQAMRGRYAGVYQHWSCLHLAAHFNARRSMRLLLRHADVELASGSGTLFDIGCYTLVYATPQAQWHAL